MHTLALTIQFPSLTGSLSHSLYVTLLHCEHSYSLQHDTLIHTRTLTFNRVSVTIRTIFSTPALTLDLVVTQLTNPYLRCITILTRSAIHPRPRHNFRYLHTPLTPSVSSKATFLAIFFYLLQHSHTSNLPRPSILTFTVGKIYLWAVWQ